MKRERDTMKIVIIVLAVLLGISLSALAGIFLYHKFSRSTPTVVTVSDNLITPETTSVSLYAMHAKDSTAISFENMFPGDTVTRNFCVQVSYHGDVTVHYDAEARSGGEHLTEALCLRIRMLSDGSLLYDGPMKDMPSSVTYSLSSEESTTTDLYYEITAYLPTDVGNDYQSAALEADFRWWVEETKNLESGAKTGDSTPILLTVSVGLATGSVCILLFLHRKRKEEQTNVEK